MNLTSVHPVETEHLVAEEGFGLCIEALSEEFCQRLRRSLPRMSRMMMNIAYCMVE